MDVFAKGVDRILQHPRGPVQYDLTATDATALAQPRQQDNTDEEVHIWWEERVWLDLIWDSQRPVFIMGLEAREQDIPEHLPKFVEKNVAPVFTSYRAKGVVPCDHPNVVGHFTGATLEAECLRQADLIVFIGYDPVEMIPAPWTY